MLLVKPATQSNALCGTKATFEVQTVLNRSRWGRFLFKPVTLANYLGLRIFALLNAKVAQLVEHDLAKVGVAGSNPVFRSKTNPLVRQRVFLLLQSTIKNTTVSD